MYLWFVLQKAKQFFLNTFIYANLSSAVRVPLALAEPGTLPLLPAVTGPYMVSPDSSNFFINLSGELVVETGLELDDARNYQVTSSDFNGTFIMQLIANGG